MNFTEFALHYPDEASCKKLVKKYREKEGVVCKKCNGKKHYWNKAVEAFDCKKCGFRTTLRSGTVMESSKLPFQYWIYAIFFLTMTKKGVSALELQRQLGHKRYEPIWAMLHKLRAVMGLRDSKHMLEDIVELDKAFFKTHNDHKDKQQRDEEGNAPSKVLVMAKIKPERGRPKKHHKPSVFRFVRMVVMPDPSSNTKNKESLAHITPEATMNTNSSRDSQHKKEVVTKNLGQIVFPKKDSKILPWVQMMIYNAKCNLLGINHNIKDCYLQNYLDEFCYKTNRRYVGKNLFDRLMAAAVNNTSYGKFRNE